MEQEKSKIWLSSPHMSDEGYELEYVKGAFATNWIAPLGPNVTEFENEIARKVGTKHAAALISGTAAIHLALIAAGVGEGDIVICPTLTFVATANPILYQNATPVFVDSDPETWNMDPGALKEALEKYQGRVKAVIVVYLYGFSPDMDAIMDLCREHGVVVIEDAAEALGVFYEDRHAGTMGDYGVYSFNGNKIITTSGGGMLVSENAEKIEKARFWATQARDKARHYQHSELGFNYRMSNVVAGIGRGQLKVLEQRVARKKYINEFYRRELSGLEGIGFMPVNPWNRPNFWLTVITLTGQVRPIDLMERLEQENIEARPVWKPMHLQPLYEQYDYIGGTSSEEIFSNGVCLPSDTKMTDDDLYRVTSLIRTLWS